jgi:hypothetical protein
MQCQGLKAEGTMLFLPWQDFVLHHKLASAGEAEAWMCTKQASK